MKITEIKPTVYEMAKQAEERLGARFREIDAVAEHNTRKVMEAFQNHRVSEACFAGTTGYGYDDLGRETLDKIYADVFGKIYLQNIMPSLNKAINDYLY